MMNNTILIEKKQLKDIANWMKVEHPAELPKVLQGIFFMNGNVLPDNCLTMYSSDWNADPLTLLLRVFDPVIWTFPSSMAGRMLVYLAKFSRFTYLFRFSDATLQHGHITPIVFGWSVLHAVACRFFDRSRFRALRMEISGIEETPVSADLLTADIHSAEL